MRAAPDVVAQKERKKESDAGWRELRSRHQGSRGAHCADLSQTKIKRCSTPFRGLRQKASLECKRDTDYRETTFVIMVIPPSGKYATSVHSRVLDRTGV